MILWLSLNKNNLIYFINLEFNFINFNKFQLIILLFI